jgi:hypothetical protein
MNLLTMALVLEHRGAKEARLREQYRLVRNVRSEYRVHVVDRHFEAVRYPPTRFPQTSKINTTQFIEKEFNLENTIIFATGFRACTAQASMKYGKDPAHIDEQNAGKKIKQAHKYQI